MLEEQYTNHAGYQGQKRTDAGGASVDGGARAAETPEETYDLCTPPPGCSVIGRGTATLKDVETSPLAKGMWPASLAAANLGSLHSLWALAKPID